jgi:hypothetical protein
MILGICVHRLEEKEKIMHVNSNSSVREKKRKKLF